MRLHYYCIYMSPLYELYDHTHSQWLIQGYFLASCEGPLLHIYVLILRFFIVLRGHSGMALLNHERPLTIFWISPLHFLPFNYTHHHDMTTPTIM